MSFYVNTLRRLVSDHDLDPHAPTLVVAGGQTDRDALLAAGFTNVTITNLDTRMSDGQFAPYDWARQDAEALNYPDASFAQVIEHAGLHHCASPHRALLEMYRVASKCVLAFEARDSAMMRIATKLGLADEHEIEAVVWHGLAFGGFRNSHVPNYVYRWTEREVEKALASADPTGAIPVRYFYGLRLPFDRLALQNNRRAKLIRLAAKPIEMLARLPFKLFPRQGNDFAFWIGKPAARYPWFEANGTTLNRSWLAERYRLTA
jgi:SAM-dependent methyltransferase